MKRRANKAEEERQREEAQAGAYTRSHFSSA